MTEAKITEIRGIEIGHATDSAAATGCTAILCREGAVAGVDVRGGSPGTRETDALDPVNLRQSIHAVILAGGSAFGLDAASGAMQFLEERGVGRDVGVARVPIVCGAILFDLKCGSSRVRPDKAMGYAACESAERGHEALLEGNVGAGTGATVGTTKGMDYAMKGGIGASCLREGNLLVGAVIAVNCVGDVVDPGTGRILAGLLADDRASIEGSESRILANLASKKDFFSGNTIIGAVITNARLAKTDANRLASVSHNGIARSVRPSHTVFDGDTLFALATGEVDASNDAVGILAVHAVERAIASAVMNAESLAGIPSWKELFARK